MGLRDIARGAIGGGLGAAGAGVNSAIRQRIKKQQNEMATPARPQPPTPGPSQQMAPQRATDSSRSTYSRGLSGNTVFSDARKTQVMRRQGELSPASPQPTMQQRPSQAQQATPGTPSSRRTIRGVKPRFNR